MAWDTAQALRARGGFLGAILAAVVWVALVPLATPSYGQGCSRGSGGGGLPLSTGSRGGGFGGAGRFTGNGFATGGNPQVFAMAMQQMQRQNQMLQQQLLAMRQQMLALQQQNQQLLAQLDKQDASGTQFASMRSAPAAGARLTAAAARTGPENARPGNRRPDKQAGNPGPRADGPQARAGRANRPR